MKTVSLKKYFPFLLLLLLLLNACKQAPQVLTKAEAIAFAEEIENTIKKGEGDFLDNSFDKKEFIKRMNLPNSPEKKGAENSVLNKLNLGKQISNSLSDQDNFEFIKYYVKEDKHHIIFRLYNNKESTLNYHDYELLKMNNTCRIADVYVYMSGETLSETMKNIFKNFTQETGDTEQQTLAGIEDLKTIRKLMQYGEHAKAKKLYHTLPEYLKKSKAVHLMNVLNCSNLSNDEYAEAIKNYQEAFPNEPSINLIMIDGYFLQKEYTKMLEAINALDAQINKDPLLDFYRYLSYNLLEDKKNARLCITRLLTNMPDFQRGYQELIALDLQDNNKKEADSLITIYRKKAKFNQGELTDIINYSR